MVSVCLDEVTQKSSGAAADLATPLMITPLENKRKKPSSAECKPSLFQEKKSYELVLAKQEPELQHSVVLLCPLQTRLHNRTSPQITYFWSTSNTTEELSVRIKRTWAVPSKGAPGHCKTYARWVKSSPEAAGAFCVFSPSPRQVWEPTIARIAPAPWVQIQKGVQEMFMSVTLRYATQHPFTLEERDLL